MTTDQNTLKHLHTDKSFLLKKFLVMTAVILSIISVITCFMTYINIGLTDSFFSHWLSTFIRSAVILVPLGGALVIGIELFVSALLPMLEGVKKKLAFSFFFAATLEAIMGLASAISKHGLILNNELVYTWGQAFITALPLGFAISLMMSFIVLPKIDNFILAWHLGDAKSA